MTLAEANRIVLNQDDPGWVPFWRKLRDRDRRRFYSYAWLWLQAKCMTSFWHHIWFGIYWQSRKYYDSPIYETYCGWLEDWTVKEHGSAIPIDLKVALLFREFNKTQLGMGYIAWKLARNRNHRWLIRAWTLPKAQELLVGVRSIIDSQRFQNLYPWVQAKKKPGLNQREQWGKDSLMLERDDIGVRVSSLEAIGHETEPTGGHFNGIYYDDYAIDTSENSDVYRPQLFENFQNDVSLLMAGGQRLMKGTIWRKDGFNDSARKKEGDFEGKRYDVFVQPDTIPVSESEISGRLIEMLPDRRTFRLIDERIPDDRSLCQARLTFDNLAHPDTETVIREIVGNDRNSFRVNRPIESVYGSPLAFVIGNERPAAPNKFTLDEIDLLAPEDKTETVCDRSSLVQKRINQGPYVYACQMKLDPLARGDMLFNADNLQWVNQSEFRDIVQKQSGIWFRKADLSSAKKTGSYTCITDGFVTFDGIYIPHITWGLLEPMAIMLDLFQAVIRLRQDFPGSAYRHLQMEKAHIEDTIGRLLPMAEANPYEFFYMAGGRYRRFAEQFLIDGERIHIRTNEVSRSASKMDRNNELIQPILEQRRIFIVQGCPNSERAVKELTEATLDSETDIDFLDTLADLCAELRPRIKEQKRVAVQNQFDQIQKKTRRKLAVSSRSGGGWP